MYRVTMDIQKEANKHKHRAGVGVGAGVMPPSPLPTANARLTSSFNPDPPTQPAAQTNHKLHSLQKVIEYTENTSACRHALISLYFGAPDEMSGAARSKSIASRVECDHACDVCKEGAASVRRRRDRGLASDEEASQFTQRRGWEYE